MIQTEQTIPVMQHLKKQTDQNTLKSISPTSSGPTHT